MPKLSSQDTLIIKKINTANFIFKVWNKGEPTWLPNLKLILTFNKFNCD